MATGPTALLVSLRLPTDPMAAHERLCFAERAELPFDDVKMHFMADGLPKRSLLKAHDAVFFGGSGEYSVLDDLAWIRDGLDALVEVVDLGVPAYASCFGFQGLALALGGEVRRDDDLTEMGSTRLHLTDDGRGCPLFSCLPDPFWAQEGHHDHVMALPAGVTLLASSDRVPAQAFRVDGTPFWASQFHPELTLQRCLDRFHHYRSHYIEEGQAEAILESLQGGDDTPEVAQLLSRLVRHEF